MSDALTGVLSGGPQRISPATIPSRGVIGVDPATLQEIVFPAVTGTGETQGSRLRRMARSAWATDPWNFPYMKSIGPWQPLGSHTYYDLVVNNGSIYVCLSPLGTSKFGPGPLQITSTLSSADGIIWAWFGANTVTVDPGVIPALWTASQTYPGATQVTNANNVYAVVYSQTQTFTVSGVSVSPTAAAIYQDSVNGAYFYVASTSISGGSGMVVAYGVGNPSSSGSLTKVSGTGDSSITFASSTAATTSAGSGGPTGTGGMIVDGGIVWTYMGPYVASPYSADFPTVTFTTTDPNPATLPAIYKSYAGPNLSAIGAIVGAGGAGYRVGDTITPVNTGGTVTTPVVLTVTSVSSGAVTGVSVTTAGNYSVLPTALQSQSSTSGAGTGASFWVKYTFPGWGRLRNCSIAGNVSNVWGRAITFQALPDTTPVSQDGALEFWTDAPVFAIQLSELNSTQGINVIINNRQYSRTALLPNVQSGSNANYYIFTFAAGGRKPRLIRIEWRFAQNIPSIFMDYNSSCWIAEDQDPFVAAFISDSVLQGSNYHPYVCGNSIPHRIQHQLGWANFFNFSQAGTGYINPGTGPGVTTGPYGNRVLELLSLKADFNVLMGSSNDGGANAASSYGIGATTQVTTYSPHGLTTGNSVTFSGAQGTGASLLNGIPLTVMVTTSTVFTVAVNTTGLTLTSAFGTFINTATGNPPVQDAEVALFQAIRAGSSSPIVVFGLWSPSSYDFLNSEAYLKAAVAQFDDPLTFYRPIINDPYLPWVTWSGNTDPAPSGLIFPATNINVMVNPSDNFHPIDYGAQYLALRISRELQNIFKFIG